MKSYPTVIKWFGSKRTVAKDLAEHFLSANTYFEPFVGGGAMIPYAKATKGYASDIIPELIDLWNNIKNNPAKVAHEYELRWSDLQHNGADIYYKIRDNFNITRNCFDFLFLTRTCVNGMIRYNEKGDFNNSFHLSRPGINPDTLRKIIFQWNGILQKIEFLNVDYRECLSMVKAGDFVFLDPPYGGTKSRYTKAEFVLDDFYKELDRLNSVGAKWMLTFDGAAGDRTYSYAPPTDVYKQHYFINTGNSAFSRLMDNKKDMIHESVYLNFEPIQTQLNLF